MSYATAIEQYHAGRLLAARGELVAVDGVDAAILAILVDARLERTEDAIELAKTLWARVDVAGEARVRVGSLLAFLQTRVGEVDAAVKQIADVKRILRTIPTASADVESDAWLTEAVVQFAQQRLGESERSAWNSFYADLDLQLRPSTAAFAPAPITTTKGRALMLIGLIRASQERYHEQYRFLREAVTLLRTARVQDLYLISFLQANQSFYARDFGQLSEIVELELIVRDSWADDLVELRVEVTRSLAFLYALNGESDRAIATIRATALQSHSRTNKLLLLADEAFFSRQLRKPIVFGAELLDGCAVADAMEWETVGSSRYALHAFAQELAYVDPKRAASYMAAYDGLRSDTSPLSNSGRRGHADAMFSAGIVALANGSRDTGLASLYKAFEIWRDIGFRWQAAMTAIELAEQTGLASFAAYADREARNFRGSWLARRVASLQLQAS